MRQVPPTKMHLQEVELLLLLLPDPSETHLTSTNNFSSFIFFRHWNHGGQASCSPTSCSSPNRPQWILAWRLHGSLALPKGNQLVSPESPTHLPLEGGTQVPSQGIAHLGDCRKYREPRANIATKGTGAFVTCLSSTSRVNTFVFFAGSNFVNIFALSLSQWSPSRSSLLILLQPMP